MNVKKHPKANLENYSKLFVQLGLVLSLVVVYVLIQNKTFDNDISILNNVGVKDNYNPEQNIEYKIEPPKKQPIPKKVILVNIKEEKNDSDVEETLFKNIDTDEPVEDPKFIKVTEIEDEYPDGIPILILESAPVFPGCKGTKEEMKACFIKKIGNL